MFASTSVVSTRIFRWRSATAGISTSPLSPAAACANGCVRRPISIINGDRPFYPLPGNLAGAGLEWGLNWCVGNQAHRWVAVHAAVLERNGRTMILSAESGAGKSTLCAALPSGLAAVLRRIRPHRS